MLNIQRILVVLDPENAEQIALTRAVEIARSTQSKLTLLTHTFELYCEEGSSLDKNSRESIKKALLARTQAWIDGLAATIEGVNDVTTEVHWCKHNHAAVNESLNNQSADLVIKSARPESLLKKLFTPENWGILRHCAAPVMLVKSAQPWRHNRILTCIDATSTDQGHVLINDNLLSYAENLSDHMNIDLHLVNSYPAISTAFAMVPEIVAPEDIQKQIHDQHSDACLRWANKYNLNTDNIYVQEGDAEEVVTRVAKIIEADAILIGSVGRTGLAGVFIGNTAEQLIDRVNCDIIVLKPNDGVASAE